MNRTRRRGGDGGAAREAGPADGPGVLELLASSPVQMEGHYTTDRSPDYFALHRCFPGSRAFVSGAGGAGGFDACVSLLRYEGRVGAGVAPYALLTDLCRRPGAGVRALHGVVHAAVSAYRDSDAVAFLCLVNPGNAAAVRMVTSPRAPLPMQRVARLRYLEVLPLARAGPRQRPGVGPATTAREVEAGLQILNAAYARHFLWPALTRTEFERRCALLPGFGAHNLILCRIRGRCEGALLTYDADPLVRLRVVRYDPLARWLDVGLRAAGPWLGPRAALPGPGGALRSMHVQALAATRRAGRRLLAWLGDEVLAQGRHTYAWIATGRAAAVVPHALKFPYGVDLYGSFKPPVRAPAAGAPVYFNVTQD